MISRFVGFSVAFGAWLLACGATGAEEYPARPIRMINPFSAGGGTDIAARAIGQKMYETWGQAVVVDNRPGAGGNIGMEVAAKSAPDGYTVLLTSGSLVTTPLIYTKVGFDPMRDFAPISIVSNAAQVVAMPASLEARSVKELVALAKSGKVRLNAGTPGIGSVGHLTVEMFKMAAGIDIVHVPYKGSAAVITDLLAGRIQLMVAGPSSVVQHIKSGKLRGLAVASARRDPDLESLPTFVESGYPEVISTNWYGVLMVAGTPKPIVEKFHRELVRIMQLPDIKERFSQNGLTAIYNTPVQFSRFLLEEQAKWRKVVQASGARVE